MANIKEQLEIEVASDVSVDPVKVEPEEEHSTITRYVPAGLILDTKNTKNIKPQVYSSQKITTSPKIEGPNINFSRRQEKAPLRTLSPPLYVHKSDLDDGLDFAFAPKKQNVQVVSQAHTSDTSKEGAVRKDYSSFNLPNNQRLAQFGDNHSAASVRTPTGFQQSTTPEDKDKHRSVTDQTRDDSRESKSMSSTNSEKSPTFGNIDETKSKYEYVQQNNKQGQRSQPNDSSSSCDLASRTDEKINSPKFQPSLTVEAVKAKKNPAHRASINFQSSHAVKETHGGNRDYNRSSSGSGVDTQLKEKKKPKFKTKPFKHVKYSAPDPLVALEAFKNAQDFTYIDGAKPANEVLTYMHQQQNFTKDPVACIKSSQPDIANTSSPVSGKVSLTNVDSFFKTYSSADKTNRSTDSLSECSSSIMTSEELEKSLRSNQSINTSGANLSYDIEEGEMKLSITPQVNRTRNQPADLFKRFQAKVLSNSTKESCDNIVPKIQLTNETKEVLVKKQIALENISLETTNLMAKRNTTHELLKKFTAKVGEKSRDEKNSTTQKTDEPKELLVLSQPKNHEISFDISEESAHAIIPKTGENQLVSANELLKNSEKGKNRSVDELRTETQSDVSVKSQIISQNRGARELLRLYSARMNSAKLCQGSGDKKVDSEDTTFIENSLSKKAAIDNKGDFFEKVNDSFLAEKTGEFLEVAKDTLLETNVFFLDDAVGIVVDKKDNCDADQPEVNTNRVNMNTVPSSPEKIGSVLEQTIIDEFQIEVENQGISIEDVVPKGTVTEVVVNEDYEFRDVLEKGSGNIEKDEVEDKCKIRKAIEAEENIIVEEDIRTDESICGTSVNSLQSDGDPDLVDEPEPEMLDICRSISKSNLDCSLSSFSTGSAWKSIIGVSAKPDGSIKSSSFISDKSYCKSLVVEPANTPKLKADCKLFTDEQICDGKKSIPIILEESSTTGSEVSNVWVRVPFNSNQDLEDAYGKDDLVETILTPKVITHSRSGLTCLPCRTLESAPFAEKFLLNLNGMGVKTPRNIQSCVWPYIFNCFSTFAIGPSESGRDLAILAPVLHLLTTYSTKREVTEPVLLILCPDIKSARQTHTNCLSILKDCLTPQGNAFAVLRIDDCDNSLNAYEFLKACDVLISTPRCLAVYMKYKVDILNLEKIKYLYMNNLDVLDERFSIETNAVIDRVQLGAIKRIHQLERENELKKSLSKAQKESLINEMALKVYGTSTMWCDLLKRIGTESHNPALVFSALQECAFYSGMKLQVRFVEANVKIERLREVIKDLTKEALVQRRCVIVCGSNAEVDSVATALRADSHSVIHVDLSMPPDVINNVRLTWKAYNNVVGSVFMVCCDENLQFLDIYNASWIVNFSLPKTLSKFNLRFSTMKDNYPNLYMKDSDKPRLRFDVFIDEENSLQLPKIVQFVKRCKVEVPEKVESLLKQILSYNDLRKADLYVPLCDQLMGFGKCSNKLKCVERHSLVSAKDKLLDWIPKAGIVKCKVIYIHHTGLFSARLLEYTDLECNTISMTQRNLHLAVAMSSHFLLDVNKQPHGTPHLGDICAVKVQRVYERCQVIKILPSPNRRSDYILCNLLEEESYIWQSTMDLLYLPNHLKDIHSTTVRIRTVGMKPAGGKDHWSATSVNKLRKHFFTTDDVILKGKIVLGIGNTLWLDNIQICKRLKSLHLDAVRCNLKHDLLREYAVENPSHLEYLYNICKSFDYELPIYTPINTVKATYNQKLPKPQWAHLNKDQYTQVYFSSVETPHTFFVRIFAHDRSLKDMEDDIQIHIEDLIRKCIYLKEITEDMMASTFYCLAKFPSDQQIYRARVENMVDDLTSQNKIYKCFFVDHGDYSNIKLDDMFPISAKFISRMPFQAIECSLFGSRAPEEGWTEPAADALYDQSFRDDLVSLKILLARYYNKTPAEVTGGNKYTVMLYDTEGRVSYIDALRSMIAIDENEMELIEEDKESLERALIELETVYSDDEEHMESEPIPEFIRQQALMPYIPPSQPAVPSKEIMTVEDADKLTEWNNMFTDFENDDEWDCTFDAKDFEEFRTLNNLPSLPPISKQANQTPNISTSQDANKDFPKSADDFVIVHKSEINMDSTFCEIPTKPDHKTPAILWYQNDNYVIVRIQLPDVNIYECNIEIKRLYFETCLDNEIFKVDMELRGAVLPKRCSHVSKGSHVFIRLRKLIENEWNSLAALSYKGKRIVYDHDHIYIDEEDSELDEEEKSKLSKGLMSRATDLINDDGDEEAREGGDDIMTHIRMMDMDPDNQRLLRQMEIYRDEEDELNN